MSSSCAKVIVALDYPDAASARPFVEQVNPSLCKLKVGKELFTREGPQLVEKLVQDGFDVFLDLKFHDIPNTVARACSVAADLGVWMVNVHASGGRTMMEAAHEAIQKASHHPLLIGVTVLTSMGREDLNEVGVISEPQEQVLRLAKLAQQSGLDGVVCSAKEVPTLQKKLGKGFCLVTPGIRPAGTEIGDQKRVMTPQEAMRNGSHYLVIGRPITQADEPVAVLEQINADIAAV